MPTQFINEMLDIPELQIHQIWEWKEAFTKWYDYSPNVQIAIKGFVRWYEQGEQIDHEAVNNALKRMRNWQEEIVNYHHCRWTNATVEGRHNRIKASQRRHYFTRTKIGTRQAF